MNCEVGYWDGKNDKEGWVFIGLVVNLFALVSINCVYQT